MNLVISNDYFRLKHIDTSITTEKTVLALLSFVKYEDSVNEEYRIDLYEAVKRIGLNNASSLYKSTDNAVETLGRFKIYEFIKQEIIDSIKDKTLFTVDIFKNFGYDSKENKFCFKIDQDFRRDYLHLDIKHKIVKSKIAEKTDEINEEIDLTKKSILERELKELKKQEESLHNFDILNLEEMGCITSKFAFKLYAYIRTFKGLNTYTIDYKLLTYLLSYKYKFSKFQKEVLGVTYKTIEDFSINFDVSQIKRLNDNENGIVDKLTFAINKNKASKYARILEAENKQTDDTVNNVINNFIEKIYPKKFIINEFNTKAMLKECNNNLDVVQAVMLEITKTFDNIREYVPYFRIVTRQVLDDNTGNKLDDIVKQYNAYLKNPSILNKLKKKKVYSKSKTKSPVIANESPFMQQHSGQINTITDNIYNHIKNMNSKITKNDIYEKVSKELIKLDRFDAVSLNTLYNMLKKEYIKKATA